jgi:hypothetical protein
MKKVDVNTFVLSMKDELDSFATFQLDYSTEDKTMPEWVDKFVNFAGYGDDEVDEEIGDEEYDDELYYGQDLQYEELVNRRKYRSFRDDDRY